MLLTIEQLTKNERNKSTMHNNV